MADIASQGEVSVNIQGAGAALKQLLKVKSLDIKDGRSTEVVMAIGVQRGAGFRRKQGGFEIDMISYRQVGRVPEVDWFKVNEAYSTFTLVTQDEGSAFRYAYTTKISKIDTKMDAEGNFEDTITLVCTTVDRT
jgi:hypothetical protein